MDKYKIRSVEEIKNLSGKKVLLRVDLNVPIKNNKVIDDFRIKKSLKTINYLKDKGAIVIIISHIGEDESQSLLPVFNILKKSFPKMSFVEGHFIRDEVGNHINSLKKGDIVLFENLRTNIGEKKNDISFARALSRYGDYYVNDAFSVSHRNHASIVGLPKHLDSYAGLLFLEEMENLSKAFNPKHPFLFILGGAKFETKMPLIKKFIKNADYLFVGGALANNFIRSKNYNVGMSLIDENDFGISKLVKNKKIILPIDLKVSNKKGHRFCELDGVSNDEIIVDVGEKTIELMKDYIKKSKFILWNGPLGIYEDGFGGATEEIVKFISKNKIDSVIGGGDTVAIISKLKYKDKLGFVSTGGGATLDFLANENLPGIKALK